MTGDTPEPIAKAFETGLARAAQAIDRDVAASGAIDRVMRVVAARVAEHRRARRSIWFAVAAALIIAAGLGSLADLALIGARRGPGREVVVMDPLIFGTTVVDQR